jgi:hypothetical protein
VLPSGLLEEPASTGGDAEPGVELAACIPALLSGVCSFLSSVTIILEQGRGESTRLDEHRASAEGSWKVAAAASEALAGGCTGFSVPTRGYFLLHSLLWLWDTQPSAISAKLC